MQLQVVMSRTNDDDVVNRWHVQPGTNSLEQTAAAGAAAFAEAWEGTGTPAGKWRDHFPSNVRPREIRAYDLTLSPPRTPWTVEWSPQLGTGQNAGTAIFFPQIAHVITLDALEGGRRGRGRTYLGPLGGGQTGGRFTASMLEDTIQAMERFIDTLNGLGVTLVILSSVDGFPRTVRRLSCDDIPDVIRRRRWLTATASELRQIDQS